MEDRCKASSLTLSPLWIFGKIEKPNQNTAFLMESGKEGESLGLSLMTPGS